MMALAMDTGAVTVQFPVETGLFGQRDVTAMAGLGAGHLPFDPVQPRHVARRLAWTDLAGRDTGGDPRFLVGHALVDFIDPGMTGNVLRHGARNEAEYQKSATSEVTRRNIGVSLEGCLEGCLSCDKVRHGCVAPPCLKRDSSLSWN